MTDDAAPITHTGTTVVLSGDALPLMYRAVLALIARRHRDGLAASPLLQQARIAFFRATVMSSRRHGIDDSPSPVSRCAGQDGDLIGVAAAYFPSTQSFSVRSWNVANATESSLRSSADLLILARTVEPSACISSTMSSSRPRIAETTPSLLLLGTLRKISRTVSDLSVSTVWPSMSAKELLTNNTPPSVPTASTGTGMRSSTTSAGNCCNVAIGDWPTWPLRRRSNTSIHRPGNDGAVFWAVGWTTEERVLPHAKDAANPPAVAQKCTPRLTG